MEVQGPGKGPWKAGRGLGGGLGAGEDCGRLILLHRDGCRKVGVEGSGDRTTDNQLKPNVFICFFGKNVDGGVVWPTGREGMHNILEGNS